MGMDVDEAGGDHVPANVDHAIRLGIVEWPDLGHLPVADGDAARIGRSPGPVDDPAVPDQEIEAGYVCATFVSTISSTESTERRVSSARNS